MEGQLSVVTPEQQSRLAAIVGDAHVLAGERIAPHYTHDESLTMTPVAPELVVQPATTAEVADVVALCSTHRIPVTARGNGTGMSGGCVAVAGGILLSMERMNRVIEIDTDNHVAVVEPAVTLGDLEEHTLPLGLVYPILPGERSATIGGNVATNAGGMRAVKYGVTRNNVLGLTAVLASGEVLRCGGKFVKASTGLDLTQLILGSEGQLGIVTEAVLRLRPFLPHRATLLLPFKTLAEVTAAVPALLSAGAEPLMLEYIDALTMAALEQYTDLSLGLSPELKEAALAYLVVVVEARSAERLQDDIEQAGACGVDHGAMDVFSVPAQAGGELLRAREQAFWVAKKTGANEIVDVVIPRAALPGYMERLAAIAQEHGTFIAGCGHAGDGNVHLSVYQPDREARKRALRAIFEAGMEMGGVISAEHGIGAEKRELFVELEDPVRLAVMRRIKQALDPHGILNPGKALG